MKNIKTVKVLFGNSIRHKIARFLHRIGLVKIIYQRPIFGDDYDEIGAICTMKGVPAALWLIGKMFEQREAIQFVIPEKFTVI